MDKIKNRQVSRRTAIILNLILVMAMVLVVFAQTSTASAVTCKFKHKVLAGETLIYIGQMYQYDWREIAEANDIKEPYVLTAGQVLCIPGGTKPEETVTTTTVLEDGTEETTTTAKVPSLTAGASMNSVYIKVEGFPKFTTYYVSIKYIPRTGASPELRATATAAAATAEPEEHKDTIPNIDTIRIGRIRTDKNGFYEGWFRISYNVDQQPEMQVCLKNVMTDTLSCVNFDNPHHNYSFSDSLSYDATLGWVMDPKPCAKWGR